MSKQLEERLKGMIVLSHTPLNNDYTLNEKGIEKYVDWVIKEGATGIWMDGIASECMYLDEDMRKRSHEVFYSAAKGKLVMGCGVFGYNPFQSIRYAKHAEELGYDFAFLNAPKINATNEEIYNYFKMVHDNTNIPLGIYNPGPGPYLSPELVARIADLERFVVMKVVRLESSYAYELYQLGVYEKLKVFPARTVVLNLILGAVGVISPVQRYKVLSDVYATYMKGDIIGAIKKEASEINGGPGTISKGNLGKPSEIGKAVVSQIVGTDMGPYMAPLTPPTKEGIERAKEMIRIGKGME